MIDRPSSTLELALGAKSKIAVLRLLFQSRLGFSGAALARHTGMGLYAVQGTLAALENMGLVEAERGNREHRYRLNERHYLVAHGLEALFEGEKQMRQSLIRDLHTVLKGKVLSAGIFGSFARGDAGAQSDIDVFVLVKSAKDKEKVSEMLSDAQIELTRRYGWPLQPVIFEERQLKARRGNVRRLFEQASRDWNHVTGLEPQKLSKSK